VIEAVCRQCYVLTSSYYRESIMNARARMSSKGQVVVPKSVRETRGWTEGTELEFVDKGEGVLVQRVRQFDPRFPPITIEEFLASRIKIDRPFPTDREIEETMLEEAGRRFNATRR
jgi:AbrB family looped-hinge helix DNA binding protein